MVWWHVGVNNYGYGVLLLGEVQVQSFACPIAIALFILGLKKTLLHVFHFFFVSLPTEYEYKWALVTAQYLCSHPQLSL